MSSRRTDRPSSGTNALPEALRSHERPAKQPHSAQERQAKEDRDRNVTPPPVDADGNVHDDGRGRDADSPSEIPAKGWKDVGARVYKEIKDDNMGLVGAGVAFYSLLALFPAMVALISLYGLLVEPSQAAKQAEELLEFMPASGREVIKTQLTNITSSEQAGLGIGLALSLLAALWSASSGMRALMTGLNIAYDEKEGRKFIKLRLSAMVLTLGAIVFTAVAMGAVIGVPAAFDSGEPLGMVLAWLRWPVLALLMIAALSVVYRYGPDRDEPRWGWVSWGAGIATLLWVLMTAAFSFYVSSFGKFQATYGTLAGVIVLMTWLSLSSFIVLIGAEINAELERQTAEDTTTGPEKPIGQRDAYAADTVGATAKTVMAKDKK